MTSSPTPDPKNSMKRLLAIGVLAYLVAFFLFSAAWNLQSLSWSLLAPLFISLVAVVVYVALGVILPSKWQLIVFSVGALIICIWSWNIPKTWQDCFLAETKAAKTDATARHIIRICKERFK